ncbi:hypothetical protein SAMN05428989_3134 [Pseudoxanthomonas sp. GM95]|uniref:hypothetical protein n=1 Tax=Pseudoxanthomonas sp. GM95 TaxID=1881043 RepID=UPI0008C1440C|nr:hypothetical protein [Pseudoxanthomonas sp. GM95]SEM12756.1 hypothetical protein SAMN05428989_3134 [Pseudoxanthomonas sp. GM95]
MKQGRGMRSAIGVVLLMLAMTAQAADKTASDVVARVYRDFAWEAVMPGAGTGLAEQPEMVLRRYFTPGVARQLAADAACKARRGEICGLDFVPLWASQDPAAQDLTIVASPDPGTVDVRFKFPSTGERIALKFRLVPIKAGWRIADIKYPNGSSLVEVLAHGP